MAPNNLAQSILGELGSKRIFTSLHSQQVEYTLSPAKYSEETAGSMTGGLLFSP
tara:strand:- start:120 stop:281 length:162 start_codon:yes stop_codon:yes gene_type:complete